MGEPRLRLFAVQCRLRGEEQAHTYFVPAFDADEAILRAQATVRETQAAGHDVTNPFQDYADVEVRVGTFRSGESSEIEFGDWLHKAGEPK